VPRRRCPRALHAALWCVLALGALAPLSDARAATAATSARDSADALTLDIFRQLISINTTDTPAGSVTLAAEAMAKRLRDAGFAAADITVAGPNERKKNLVARLRGSGAAKPVLLIGHLDVVDARRTDWSTDPFTLIEKDGYFYGRGTIDMKVHDAIMIAALIRWHRAGWRPARDVIVALTADEESGCCNGVDWLMKNRRELIAAPFVINFDDYGVVASHGVPQFFQVDASEKLYADYQLLTVGPGGHSSEPVADNPIYTLMRGLRHLEDYEFPVELNPVTRAYYQRMQQVETGQRAADMRAILATPPDLHAAARLSRDTLDHSRLHTTCVATRLAGGHANNALPQRATAVINCRILPGHSAEEVRQQLQKVLAEPQISIAYVQADGTILREAPAAVAFSPPPLLPQVMQPLEAVVSALWPRLPVIPGMSEGASDATVTMAAGIPTYTFSGLMVDREDDREHGRDERVRVQAVYQAREFFDRYLKLLAGN
jgi:acetylornithine deacetylase/succinyl-diaminopimelate desuccinylase-like protein